LHPLHGGARLRKGGFERNMKGKNETTTELVERVASWPVKDRITALRNELVRLTSRQTLPRDEQAIALVRDELRELGALG
jgi:hypothetical protein